MIDALTAILTGGATGLFGTALSFGADFFRRRQAHAQEMELRRLDMELARIEATGAERAAAIAAEAAENAAAWGALEASYGEARQRFSRRGDSGWLVAVDVVRGLMRPALTLGSLFLVAAVYWSLGATDIEVLDIRPRVVDTVLYVATTCVLWWFGTRAPARGAGPAAGGR